MALEPLAGRRAADLFAGSGALGIEALSRAAAHVHFVEAGRPALRALEENLESLGLGARATVWPVRWPAALERLSAALRDCDLVLADPPYGGGVASDVLRRLGEPGRLRPGALLVVEHHAKDELPAAAGCLRRERVRRYGETAVSWYRVADSGSEGPAEET